MENINLSNIIGDNCINSLVLAFRSMFCTELVPNESQVETFITKYLADYKDVISLYLDKNEIDNYCFVTDTILKKREVIDDKIKKIVQCGNEADRDEIARLFEEKRALDYTNLFNSGIYNLGMILLFIDESIKTNTDLLYANSMNSVEDYPKDDHLLVEEMNLLSMIHFGISSYVIEFHQKNQQFNWNRHYDVSPNMQSIINNQRKYQCCKIHLVEKNPNILSIGDCFLSDILMMIDLYRVNRQCILEKFMVSLLFIAVSPEYDEWMQQYAYTIVDILNEIMFCGEVHQLYLQDGYYNTMSNSEKTSKDATTRMSIIFSTNNDDIYILRVDLPHKGEKSFHMNMEEVVGETILPTGYPMTFEEFEEFEEHEEIKKFKKLNPNCYKKVFHDLFFVLNERIWFRTKFETRLKHTNIEAELRDKLKKLFHRQAHISITSKMQEENNCENQIAFVNEIKKYLKKLSVPKALCLSFGKDDIAYSREMKKIRGLFCMENYIMKLIFAQNDCRVKAEEALSLLKKYMDVERVESENVKVMSIVEISERLEKFMSQEKL